MEDTYAVGVGSIIPIDFQELKLPRGKVLKIAEVTVTNQEHHWDMKYEPLCIAVKTSALEWGPSCGL